jgi:nuclear pore complex protein Nup93
VTGLELAPTLEDVFHADSHSVEDYLQQIQDMTILTAIQVGGALIHGGV